VPVRAAVAEIPEPHPLAVTPAPSADLRFSCSAWSTDGGFDEPTTRRAPRVGDAIFGFKLVGELGRGAFARVFLAEQEALANRPVALKVTLKPTREAERLARLQHTNVVPVYSVHNEGTVQVICMPFLGRVTLADLIRAYRTENSPRSSGRKSTSARAARSTEVNSKSKLPKSDGKVGPQRAPTWTWQAEEAPPIVGDPVAVLQVLAQLADGLAHAHERGILHLDLKPANVLLADTGEPMLLDFNLSFDSANPARELVGGTMPYMAIEQLRDMRNRGKGEIDARTDLYALGAVAYELLTGQALFPTSSRGMRDIDAMIELRRKGPPSIRELNPEVTPAVEAIVRKLLAAEPADRYQSAAELRTDIERHLNDQPLKYAREASVRERFAKWRRRNPRLPLKLLAACLIGLTLGLGGVAQKRADANARHEAVMKAEGTHAALDVARLDLILPDDSTARQRGLKRAAELLASYGLPDDLDWKKRPEVRKLSAAERDALAGHLGELAMFLAHAKWQEALARPEAQRRELATEAWKLNATARACFPEGSAPPALDRQAAVIAPAAGETFTLPADAPKEPKGTRAEFLEAAFSFMNGQFQAAETLLKDIVKEHPNHGAAQFLLAYCREKKGNYDRALDRYDTAAALLPKDPRPAYQRGMLYTTTRKPEEAEAEFTKAIEFDDRHADAYRCRAMARYRLAVQNPDGDERRKKLLAGAEADLTAALARGASAVLVHYVRAKVRDALGDRAGAEKDRAAVKGVALKYEMDYLVRGWTRIDTDAKAALADFRTAAGINPRSLIALQNQAHVLAEQLKDNEGALVVCTKVAELYPEFAPALAGRAVVLARLGKRDDAIKEIERARLLSSDPTIIYQAASVYALTSKTNPKDRAKALKLLREAFNAGYRDLKGIASDTDLDPIRDDADFLLIRQSAEGLFAAK
jgi:serine/threonine protein kinase/Flp pilus assembly protein TadD